jgi:hypothetical protein
MGYSYVTNCKKFEDPNGFIKMCKRNRVKIDMMRDSWDIIYGRYPYSYEVYALTDSTKPIVFSLSYLSFTHEPFYIGHGKYNKRFRESMALGRQKDKYTKKVRAMIKIIEQQGGVIRPIQIGKFYTKEKASIVEKKIISLFDLTYPGMLQNSLYNACQVPLFKSDCNIICEPWMCNP